MAVANTPQSEIGTWVRNFVHYGNLVENYTKQAGAARKLRDDYEGKVINSLRVNNMQNAVIQISGARLQYGEEKTVPALSMPRLEGYLHAYFKQKGNGFDETDAILRYLKLQKTNDTQIVARLKKTNVNVPGPANVDKKDTGLK
jgi:P pilus assembly chaperone PapD